MNESDAAAKSVISDCAEDQLSEDKKRNSRDGHPSYDLTR
jgi:hypothetical protein